MGIGSCCSSKSTLNWWEEVAQAWKGGYWGGCHLVLSILVLFNVSKWARTILLVLYQEGRGVKAALQSRREKISVLFLWCPSLVDTTVVFIHHVGRLIFEGLVLSRTFCQFCRMLFGFILCFFQLIFLLYLAFNWQSETQGYKFHGITVFLSMCDAEWHPHFSALMVAVFRLGVLCPAQNKLWYSWGCFVPPSFTRSLPQDYPVFVLYWRKRCLCCIR